MKTTERIRELRNDPPTPEELAYKTEQGWSLAAIEWQREVEQPAGAPRPFRQAPPFGLRVAEEVRMLEEDPAEAAALQAMLGLVIDDEMSFSQAAVALNERGIATRDGQPWTQVRVFEMMPRIVEAAPRILASEDWSASRQRAGRKTA